MVSSAEAMQLVREWHRQELLKHYEHPPARIVMGTPVWGEPYTYDHAIYGLMSIIARENRQALDAAGWSLVYYTDAKAHKWLEQRTQAHGIPAQFRQIPDAILDQMPEHGNLKYPLLAAIHNILIHEAGRIDAGFSMITADSVYSSAYFANLLRLAEHHDAIPHTGFSVNRSAYPPIDNHRQHNGTLRIPARNLGQISIDHMITPWCNWELADNFDLIPPAHYLYVRGADRYNIHTAHQNAAWISPDRCRTVTSDLGGTIDSELPRYMGANPYAPRLEDQMTMLALGGNGPPTEPIPFAEWKAWFWSFIGHNRQFLPYFTQPCPVPAPFCAPLPDHKRLAERIDRLMQRLDNNELSAA